MFILNDSELKWVDAVWNKICKKVEKTAQSVGDKCFAYTTENGKFVDKWEKPGIPSWWTNGFWVGIMWTMYWETNNELYKTVAQNLEDRLDLALEDFTGLQHDVGFMWLLSSVANYKITKNQKSRTRSLHVAGLLAGRFNSNGNFIRAWDHGPKGRSIIDSMMNLPLLYWATYETEDPRFRQIAIKHANKVEEHFVRGDGSVKHIVDFDPETGEYIENQVGQGYSKESSWTRGQAWALYGFILSYIHTKEARFLDASKRVAHYFIAALQDNYVPPCDFRSPIDPEYKDTTAGTCAACGLIEIAKHVPEFEQAIYLKSALNILMAIESRCCDWSDTEDSIVQMGTEAYHFGGKNMPIIYGDYYFIEAITKLRHSNLFLW